MHLVPVMGSWFCNGIPGVWCPSVSVPGPCDYVSGVEFGPVTILLVLCQVHVMLFHGSYHNVPAIPVIMTLCYTWSL